MGHVTGAELSAAVSNAGGIGTIGAIGMSPEGCRAEVQRLRTENNSLRTENGSLRAENMSLRGLVGSSPPLAALSPTVVKQEATMHLAAMMRPPAATPAGAVANQNACAKPCACIAGAAAAP